MSPSCIYIDVETGGFDRKKHALIEVGWALLDAGLQPITGDSICILPEPGFEVTSGAADINGYTPEIWEERCAVPLATARERIHQVLSPYAGLPKLAHNAASMDKPWIEHYFPFLSPPGSSWVCSKEMLRKYLKRQGIAVEKGSLTLDNLCKIAGYHRVDRHSAMEDSYAGAAGTAWLAKQGIPLQ